MLPIILYNIPVFTLTVKDVVVIGGACKEFHNDAKEYMKLLSKNYGTYLKRPSGHELAKRSAAKKTCVKCNASKRVHWNPFVYEFRCEDCYGATFSKTQVLQDYKLKIEDIECLDYDEKYIRNYRQHCKFFWASDVIQVAMLKHQHASHSSLMAFLTAPKENKAKTKRQEQLDKVIDKLSADYREAARKLSQVCDFLKNGKGGIRRLEKLLKLFTPMKDAWIKNDINRPIDEYLDMCVDRSMASVIEQVIAEVKEERRIQAERNARRDLLINALAQKNLILRSDSEMCRRFIEGQYGVTLEEAVRIAEEMHFYHTFTNYPILIRRRMDAAYERAKANIYDSYGYISDEDDYKDALDEEVDHDGIRESCKRDALHFYKSNINNDMSKIPSSLV